MTLGRRHSYARAINNNGWIVGDAQTADGQTHAVLWEPVATPEPATFAFIGGGIVVAGLRRRKRARRRA